MNNQSNRTGLAGGRDSDDADATPDEGAALIKIFLTLPAKARVRLLEFAQSLTEPAKNEAAE
ncbi:MAG: hypothetical protein EOO23_04495 [Comamonadaceae bacterium]|nr:MAG: hypothetical protein EOO23_04495 [Comamonadaceae bacterium]